MRECAPGRDPFYLVIDEMAFADNKYGDFASTHEGYGVLCEEMKELLDAIHQNDRRQVEREAIQVAAVALRIVLSLRETATLERSGMTSHNKGEDDD